MASRSNLDIGSAEIVMEGAPPPVYFNVAGAAANPHEVIIVFGSYDIQHDEQAKATAFASTVLVTSPTHFEAFVDYLNKVLDHIKTKSSEGAKANASQL